jgi:DNA adenine methylase
MYNKPFLKWAGGKYRILDKILQELPLGDRFVEPFAGSCAVYLNMRFPRALVCDLNRDLVSLYRHIQHEGENFIHYCASFFTPENNTRDAYLDLRNTFNDTSDSRKRAALLLYLNRHAFNGLVRYNSKDLFNVPFGKYKKPYFPLEELRIFCRKTQSTDTEFQTADFRNVFSSLKTGDVVYCDPPYVPLSATASFTAYAGKAFNTQDQCDLVTLARDAWQRGIVVVLSNHDTSLMKNLYADAKINRFTVQRFISCNGDNRGAAPELLAVYR